MTAFAIYDTETYAVKRTIVCKDEHIAGQCRDGEDFIILDAEVPTHLYKVIDGKLVEQEPPEPDVLGAARGHRDRLLAASDWTQAPDNRLTPEQRAAWAVVREQWRSVVDNIKAGIAAPEWAAPPELETT
jgi:hypothetical protein